MAFSGYKEELIDAFIEISQQRAGISEWIEGYYRGSVDQQTLESEATAQGVPTEVVNLLVSLRERIFSVQELLNAYYRQIITPTEYTSEMERLGYPQERSSLLLQIAEPLPPLQDIIRLAVRDAWRDDVAARWGYDEDYQPIVGEHLQKLGYDPDWAVRYWRAHWELPSVTWARDMVHRGIISEEDFKTLLRIADYPRGWRDALTESIYAPYTRVDVRRMYKLGVLDESEVIASYRALGYDEEHARNLTEFTIKYEAADTASKPEQYKQLSLTLIERAYLKNLIPRSEYQTRLMELGYDSDEIEIIMSLSDLKRTVDGTTDYYAQYQRDVTSVIERSYSRGILSRDTALSYLSEVGVPETAADYMLSAIDFAVYEKQRESELTVVKASFVNQSIDETQCVQQLGRLDIPAKEQEQLLYEWSVEREGQTRRLTEAQYRRAWQTNVIDRDGYIAACRALGYTEYDIQLLVTMYAAKE